MVWLLIGALGVAISSEFSLSATQKGVLVAVPLLGGAILRVFVGPLADQIGAKPVGLYLCVLQMVALVLGWHWGASYYSMLGVGLLLGCAGASFAIALPIASAAYPPISPGVSNGGGRNRKQRGAFSNFFCPEAGSSIWLAEYVRCHDYSGFSDRHYFLGYRKTLSP